MAKKVQKVEEDHMEISHILNLQKANVQKNMQEINGNQRVLTINKKN